MYQQNSAFLLKYVSCCHLSVMSQRVLIAHSRIGLSLDYSLLSLNSPCQIYKSSGCKRLSTYQQSSAFLLKYVNCCALSVMSRTAPCSSSTHRLQSGDTRPQQPGSFRNSEKDKKDAQKVLAMFAPKSCSSSDFSYTLKCLGVHVQTLTVDILDSMIKKK